MSPKEFIYPKLILEKHVDWFLHVNNSTYLELFEEARWDIIKNRGFGLGEIQKKQLGPVVLEVTIRYMKEIKVREQIHIHTVLLNYEKKIGELEQKMVKSDGTIASQALFKFGLFDLQKRTLVLPTPDFLFALGKE